MLETLSMEMHSARVAEELWANQTNKCNHKPHDAIISAKERDLDLSFGDLEYLSSLDEAQEANQTSQPLIQRVPSMLSTNTHFLKCFKPRVIAIGPLHHDDPNLQGGEKLKLKLAAHFIKMHGFEREMLYKKIKMEVHNLKKCYDPEEIRRYDDEKLTWMFFLDGCAALQVIYLGFAPTKTNVEQELKIKNDLLTFVYLDLLLLENQLPYQLLELLTSSSSHGAMFKESIRKFINDNVMTIAEMKSEQQISLQKQQAQTNLRQKQKKPREPAHLMDLLRSTLLSKTDEMNPKIHGCDRFFKYITKRKINKSHHHSHTFRNVKELREAGIWFRPSETSRLKDISFSRACCVGKLTLPPITVEDSTGPKFMNLIAYEMCPDFNDFGVTSYVCFLDFLIDEAEDVKVLRDAGILHNALGSDKDVAKPFNKMTTELVPSTSIYSEVKLQIQNHCSNLWIAYAAQAYHTHFRSPWTILAFLAAMAALVLSALQTYYTIHPRKEK